MNVEVKSRVFEVLKRVPQLVPRILPRIGQAVTNLVKDQLFAKGPNKQGWPSTHFYADAARSTHWASVGDAVVISISKLGFAQRYYGGIIKADNVKYLTIPARSEAYGKRAKEFGNLKLAWGRNGPYALVADKGGATRKIFQGRQGTRTEHKIRGAQEGVVMFWLKKEVNQPADHSVIPTEQEIQATASVAAELEIQRLLNRQ